MKPAPLATALALGLLAISLAGPAGSLAAPPVDAGTSAFAYAVAGEVHVQARYYDGLGSTKVSFTMLQGQSGHAGDRLSPGARCTEWHGTFHQVAIKARAADNARDAFHLLRGFALAVPPGAPAERPTPGFTFDALGGPGAWSGNLVVCDHPDGPGAVDFQGTVATAPVVRGPYAALAVVQEG
jgi:hypothetical protein